VVSGLEAKKKKKAGEIIIRGPFNVRFIRLRIEGFLGRPGPGG
jgi:hypothetical protein